MAECSGFLFSNIYIYIYIALYNVQYYLIIFFSQAAAVGATKAFAYDLTAACSGFLFGSVTAAQFIHSGAATNALVVRPFA
jgi:3-oxoacyl-[acyl-carrier-protein] synthase III